MVDVALYEAVFNMMESTLPEYDVFGAVRARTGGSLPGIVPSNTYECGDGAAIVVAGNGDAIFRRLMTAIGREDLANDPEAGAQRRPGQARRGDRRRDPGLVRKAPDRADALATLTAADVPVSRIYSVADMVRDAQFQARQMFEQTALPDGTPMKVPAVVPKIVRDARGNPMAGSSPR